MFCRLHVCFLPKLFFSSIHPFSLSPSPIFPVYAVVTRPAPRVWVWEPLEEGTLGMGGLAPSQVSHEGWKGPRPEWLYANSQSLWPLLMNLSSGMDPIEWWAIWLVLGTEDMNSVLTVLFRAQLSHRF